MTLPSTLISARPQNLWRKAKALRASFLIDAADYFLNLASALEKAQHSILILSWDFHTQCQLRCDLAPDDPRRADYELGNFLKRIARQRPELQIHILLWDYPLAYQVGREYFTGRKMMSDAPQNVHFRYDNRTPVSASQHEKVVVIDDRLAFVGGIDLTACRWDTPEHRANDNRRCNEGEDYAPFHDCELVFEGPICSRLGDLARDRWQRATGERLVAPAKSEHELWPDKLGADFENIDLGICRTRPSLGERVPVREVEAFTLDAIRSARHLVYIENQYFASERVRDAVIDSLHQPEGPEIVLVLPKRCHNPFERVMIGLIQQLAVREIVRHDVHQRLGLYYPYVPGLEPEFLHVHSKLMIIDDRILVVGSSNLNNRSMGLDSECNVFIEAGPGDEKTREQIVRCRDRLLSEHLSMSELEVREVLHQEQSLLKLIEKRRPAERSLRRLPPDTVYGLSHWAPRLQIVDPDRPSQMEIEIQSYNNEVDDRHYLGSTIRILLAVACFALFLNFHSVGEWQHMFKSLPAVWATTAGAYAIAGILLLPLTWLWVATVLVMGPLQGAIVGLGGSLVASLLSYLSGRWLRPQSVTKLAQRHSRGVARRFVLQNFPSLLSRVVLSVGPTPLLSLVAGAAKKPVLPFLVATFLRLLPLVGIVSLIGYLLPRLSAFLHGATG